MKKAKTSDIIMPLGVDPGKILHKITLDEKFK